MGRPSKLTDELTVQIAEDLEAGNYIETAAEAAGIAVSTLYNWLDWGAEGREPYAAFLEAITRARAVGEKKLLETVLEGDGKGTSYGPARAASFVLERTRPQKFAQRINAKVEDAVGRVLEVVRGTCSPTDFARVLEKLERLDREGGESASACDPEGPAEVH